jgi:hypothetical protein
MALIKVEGRVPVFGAWDVDVDFMVTVFGMLGLCETMCVFAVV